ncbi:MAG: substrate-binding domain-containing protein [Phycisphaeraceae bacterium]
MQGSDKKYEQVAEIIKNRISAGSYANGSLPGLRALANELGVSYLTVRQGLHTLCEMDLLRVSGNRNFEIVHVEKPTKKRTISLLTPIGSADNSFVHAIKTVAQEQAAKLHRYTFCHYDDEVIAQAIDSDCDLLFFFIDPQFLSPLVLEKMQQNRDRLVSLAFDYAKHGITMLDEATPAKCARLLINHLVTLGHQSIDILAITHDNEIFYRRAQCLKILAEDEGIRSRFYSAVVPEFDQEYEMAAGLAREIYQGKDKPQAICTLTVPSAIGVQRGLKDIGINTGQDCTLVSFEDLLLAKYSIPSITVAHTRDFLGATREVICTRFQNESLREHYLADAKLFLGESSCKR